MRRRSASFSGVGLLAVVLSATLIGLPTSRAAAEHADLIVDKIEPGGAMVSLELVADGFRTPVWAEAAPYNADQLVVIDQFGSIDAIRMAGADPSIPERHQLLDVGSSGLGLLPELATTVADERGLLGFAFHPGFVKNGLVYTYTSEPRGPSPDFTTLGETERPDPEAGISVIREWRVDDPRRRDGVIDPQSSRVLMRIEQPQANHNGGAIVFGPDAMLYIALGDGGSSDDEGVGHGHDGQGNGQNLSEGNVLGKILRIDPQGSDSDNGQYGVPADNPFVGTEAADEIFAYGFRNPWRMSFDHQTGDLYVGDVGQRDIEEIDRVVSGGDYGWPTKEGPFLFEGNGIGSKGYASEFSPGMPAAMIDPIAYYDHDEGTSVTGGFMYRGSAIAALAGTYVFGDLAQVNDEAAGRLFGLQSSGELVELVPTTGYEQGMLITAFGQDTSGELYLLGLQSDGTSAPAGVVLKLVPGR